MSTTQTQIETLKLAFEKMTGVPDAWINPSLRHHRQGFIAGWEAALEYASFMKDLDEALSSPNGETQPSVSVEHSATHGEPVAVIGSGFQLLYCRNDWSKGLNVGDLLYTTPPQRKPLDMTEIVQLTYDIDEDKPATMAELFRFARAIEAAHGIKE